MKILIPVDASIPALAPIPHLTTLARQRSLEVIVLNVQPRFHRHAAQFTSRAARASLRAERSGAAMARAMEALADAGVRHRALAEVGSIAERIAAVAEREGADEIVMGVGRHPAWLRWLNPSIAQGVMERTDIPLTVFARGRAGVMERYALPAGVAGIAALLLAAD